MEDRFVRKAASCKKTGNGILELFSLLAILLPVIPLFIIFYKRLFNQASIQLLAILCFLGFAASILQFAAINTNSQQLLAELFRALDCTLLLLIFRFTATNKKIADTFTFLVISSVSIVVAIYATTGFDRYATVIDNLQSLLMIGGSLLAFSQLISRRDLMLFESTLFWIGAATFFNYSMLLLIEKLGNSGTDPLQASHDKTILIYLVQFVRYLFYVIAVIISRGSITRNNQD